MSKLRVHDMAGEFGIPAEEMIALLRSMEVPVRSHLTELSDDQVSRIRARWEREKRARVAKQNAPAAPAARRRRTTAPEPEPVAATAAAAPAVRRRRASEMATAVDIEPESVAASAAPVAEPPSAPVVDVAPPAPPAPARQQQPVAETTAPAAEGREVERPRTVERPAEPRVAAAAPEAPSAPAEPRRPEPARMEPRRQEPPQGESIRPAASAAPSAPPSAPSPIASASPSGMQPTDNRPRPRPIVPSAPRPRPIASAAPGGSMTGGPPRRDDQRRGPGMGQGMGGGMGGGTGAGMGGGATAGGQQQGAGRRGKKGKRGAVDQEAVSQNIARTMGQMRGGPARRGRGRFDDAQREEIDALRAEAAEREKKTVRVNEFITVSELAAICKITPTQIVAFAVKNLGMMVTINQRLDFDQIELIAGEFGYQAVREEEYGVEDVVGEREADTEENLVFRPPVVTIMGHVDHGKTSLLDYIRKANVVAGEAGGITQHIGAYHVSLPGGREITFLDTPGHEAFTAMRARGAQVTDIVVLVVAADDSIMPQTIEAISHAKNAGVPLVVAINKIDLPQANPGKVKQELLQHNVVLEEFGGNVLSTEISAKKGTNVGELLEQILLQSEILDLKANPDRNATGTVVEAQLDPGRGPVATVLVQSGTLRVGDDFICGMYSGRVRALLDERGKTVKSAGPAIPVQVLGIEGVPMAGDQLVAVDEASDAREIAQRRQRLDREAKSRRGSRAGITLEDFRSMAAQGEKRTLQLLIKADQGGPSEALADALGQLSNAEVQVSVVHRGVGAITESDILLAKASGAIIIGFHVRPDNNARAAAEREGVDIKLYRIIYEAVSDVRAALEGMLSPEQREVTLGEAEVREVFKVPKIGAIAGCSVRSGTITRTGTRVRLIRDSVEIFDGTISSLRRFKDDVREVKEGYECGIGIENFNDIKVGDVIECYRTEEFKRTLEGGQAS